MTHSGNEVTWRISSTTSRVLSACMPNDWPCASRLGHEILASMPATPGTSLSRAARSAKPWAVGAEMLTINGAS
ncbi:hypothetical protein D3C77_792660 [compost metagenome]